MNIGYDISIKPASVAFLEIIEKPIHISPIKRARIPPMIYHRRLLEEAIETRSALSELLKQAISKVTIDVTREAIPKEVNKEIFL